VRNFVRIETHAIIRFDATRTGRKKGIFSHAFKKLHIYTLDLKCIQIPKSKYYLKSCSCYNNRNRNYRRHKSSFTANSKLFTIYIRG